VADIDEIIKLVGDSRRTLWILCGLPYSGKTSLSRKILESTDCVYVSIDEILDELGYDWDSDKLPDEAGWKHIFEISYKKAQDALKSGSSVLYDSTNHTLNSTAESICIQVIITSGSWIRILKGYTAVDFQTKWAVS